MDLLLLALRPMICPDPGMQRVFVHSELTRRLRDRLLRLDSEFDRAFLEFSGICFRRGLAHRTHLVSCVRSLSLCVRKSIATSKTATCPRRVRSRARRPQTLVFSLVRLYHRGLKSSPAQG